VLLAPATTLSLDCTCTTLNDNPQIFSNHQQADYNDTHIRYLLVMVMILNRGLSTNQLSGTIPSSIGSLVNLQELYAQSNTIHKYSPIITNNTKHNITIDTHNDTGGW